MILRSVYVHLRTVYGIRRVFTKRLRNAYVILGWVTFVTLIYVEKALLCMNGAI